MCEITVILVKPGVHNYHELWFIIRCNLILVLRRFMG